MPFINRLLTCLLLCCLFACKEKRAAVNVTLKDVVDPQVYPLYDSINRNSKELLQSNPGWVIDTLKHVSAVFPWQRDSGTHAVINLALSRCYIVQDELNSAYKFAVDVLPYFEAHSNFTVALCMCYKVLTISLNNQKLDAFKVNYYATKTASMVTLPGADTLFPLGERINIVKNATMANRNCLMKEQALRYSMLEYELAKSDTEKADTQTEAVVEYLMAFLLAKKYDSAEVYYNIGESLHKRSGYVDSTTTLGNDWLNTKLNYFYCTRRYDSALKYALQARWDEDPFGGVYTMLELYTLTGHPAAAAKQLQLAGKMIEDTSFAIPVDEFRDYYHHKTRYDIMYGNRKDAAASFNFYDSLVEDIDDAERVKMLSSIESEYNLADKQKNINKLNDANRKAAAEIKEKNDQLIIAVLGILLFAVTVIVLLLLSRQRKLRAEKQLLEVRNNKTELEQQLLRTQMEPHFIFNTLGVMQNFISNHENDKAITYLQQFAGLLRASLENSRENYVPLQDEIEALRNYISLQAMRFEDLFDYSIQLYNGYEQDNIMIPPMLLQPFVENAIYHGVRNVKHKGQIDISISKQAGSLHCVITDNGPGLQQKKTNGHRSLAVRIAHERLEIAGRETGHTARVLVENRPGAETGVIVELLIPYK